MTFHECVFACWDNPDFMREYRRLSGHAIGKDRRAPIDRMIDTTTGYTPPALDDKEAVAFLEFVERVVWLPLVSGD